MNIRQLQYFLAIAESGTITAAANKLGISQPPLSMQLKALENELGVKLVERGARSTTLTEAGKLFYNRAALIVSLADKTREELVGYTEGQSTTLRLGTISSSGVMLLGKRLQHFARQYPSVSFEVFEGNTYELLEKLQDNVLDVAVIRTPFQPEGLSLTYLEEEPMIAVGKETFFPANTDTLTLNDLKGAPLIFYRRMEHLITAAFQAQNIEPCTFCINDDARTSIMWAGTGLGVALVPQSIFSAFATMPVACRTINCPSLITRIAIATKKDACHTSVLNDFIRAFAQNI